MREQCFVLIPAAASQVSPEEKVDEIVLDFDARTRSRGQAVSRTGIDVGWFLEQGKYPRHGDTLKSDSGALYRMVSGEELVSYVTANSQFDLMRIAYHLGNRHVPLDVRPESLRFQPDHVLEDMVVLLGGKVTRKNAPFEPEDGAYHEHAGDNNHQHHHSHSDDHASSHGHKHEHVHSS